MWALPFATLPPGTWLSLRAELLRLCLKVWVSLGSWVAAPSLPAVWGGMISPELMWLFLEAQGRRRKSHWLG